jgi:hypothetical protein
MSPIALTDDQLSMLMRTAATISPDRREQFLLAVADQLRGQDIGDGVVNRAIRSVVRQYFDPPEVDDTRGSKWA